MTRMAILLILSFLSLASLGAAQSAPNVDCEDGTHCLKGNFCSKPSADSGTVCAPQYDSLCAACASSNQACIVGSKPGQISCQPKVSCNYPCADVTFDCVGKYDNDSACLPLANGDESEKCDDKFCSDGSFCVTNSKDEKLCAKQTGNDVLCGACAPDGKQCYTGAQPGQVSCLEKKSCSSDCPSEKNYCLSSDNDAGLCLPFSQI